RLLLELADRYNVPILEDDFAGDLRYEGVAQPALKALDPGGRVIYAGTFSKLLMPGLRLGFVVADGPVYRRLVEIKRVNDLAAGSLIQRALEVYVTVGRYHAHLRRLIHAYRRRRDRLMHGLAEDFPPGWAAAPRPGRRLRPGHAVFPRSGRGRGVHPAQLRRRAARRDRRGRAPARAGRPGCPGDQSLMAPDVSPAMNCRCIVKKKMTIGRVERNEPAMTVPYWMR